MEGKPEREREILAQTPAAGCAINQHTELTPHASRSKEAAVGHYGALRGVFVLQQAELSAT